MAGRLPHLAVAAALLASTFLAARRIAPPEDRPYDVAIVPPASVLRAVSLGHPTLAANAYWLRTVQYVGDLRANERGWERLYPLVDLVTDLDPAHGYAYQVAGVLLGSVGRSAESNAILEKGMRAVPDRYILPFLRAFNAFYYDGDFDEAGRYAELAARVPGAPRHLYRTALAFSVKGNRTEAAVAFLERMRAEAHDPETLKAIEGELDQARLELVAEPLDAAVARYRERLGFDPIVLEQLIWERLLVAIPPDPAGGAWYVAGGRVRSTRNSFRFTPPEQRMAAEPGVCPETGYPGSDIDR